MSADNIMIVRYHPKGGFGVAMGFLSDDNYMDATVHEGSEQFPTPQAAMRFAETQYSEYGETYHPEVDVEADTCHHCGKSLLEPKETPLPLQPCSNDYVHVPHEFVNAQKENMWCDGIRLKATTPHSAGG